MLLLAISFVGDFLWLSYWVPHWWSSEMGKVQSTLHNFVILVSFANFVLKLIVLGTLASLKQEDLKNAAGALRNQVNQLQQQRR